MSDLKIKLYETKLPCDREVEELAHKDRRLSDTFVYTLGAKPEENVLRWIGKIIKTGKATPKVYFEHEGKRYYKIGYVLKVEVKSDDLDTDPGGVRTYEVIRTSSDNSAASVIEYPPHYYFPEENRIKKYLYEN